MCIRDRLEAVLDSAFDRVGFNRVQAEVFYGNDASSAVLKKCGMVLEGCLLYTSSRCDNEPRIDVEHSGDLQWPYGHTKPYRGIFAFGCSCKAVSYTHLSIFSKPVCYWKLCNADKAFVDK